MSTKCQLFWHFFVNFWHFWQSLESCRTSLHSVFYVILYIYIYVYTYIRSVSFGKLCPFCPKSVLFSQKQAGSTHLAIGSLNFGEILVNLGQICPFLSKSCPKRHFIRYSLQFRASAPLWKTFKKLRFFRTLLKCERSLPWLIKWTFWHFLAKSDQNRNWSMPAWLYDENARLTTGG